MSKRGDWIPTHHLETVVKAGRITAGTAVVGFVAAAAILAAMAPDGALEHAQSYRPHLPHRVLLALVVLYLAPGVMLWVCSGWLEAGRVWAFFPIALIAVFEAGVLFLSSAALPVCFRFGLPLPALYLVGCCLNGASDIRDIYRQRRRQRQQRGFTPILPARPPAARAPRGRAAPTRDAPASGVQPPPAERQPPPSNV